MSKLRSSNWIVLKYVIVIFFLSRFFSLPIAGKVYSICSICGSLYVMFHYTIRPHQTKVRIDITLVVTVAYTLIQVLITLLQGGSLYSVFARMYPIVATACFISGAISRHPKELTKAYTAYVFIVFIANFLDMILFSDTTIESWGRIATSSFLIGGITGFGMEYAVVLMFLLLYREMNNGRFSNMLILISVVIILITTFMVKSATTYVCVALNLFLLFCPFGLKFVAKLKNYIIFAGYALLWTVVVVWRRFDAFQFIITGVFHRNLSLTHRTEIWNEAFRSMSGKWLMGYGAQSGSNVIQLDIGVYSLHNEVFQLIYEGGIILVLAFIIVFFVCTARKYTHNSDTRMEKVRAIIMVTIIVCLTNMITESPGIYELFFLLLLYFKSGYLVSLYNYGRRLESCEPKIDYDYDSKIGRAIILKKSEFII